MELVLGMSMAPTSIGMVLVEGENADGATVEEDNLDVIATDDAPTVSAADQVIAAILGTREGAIDAGSTVKCTGVTWTDQVEAAALRDALATRKIENVVLVSAFLAAAALAQSVGNALGYEHTAMLFVEPDTATLAVVDCADGSVTDVHRQTLSHDGVVTELVDMLAGLPTLLSRPDGVFVVGCGVDVAPVKPQLEAATMLAVSVPEEPEMALARGAALASANAPLFASSTAALAYAQDPGTGAVDPFAVSPGYLAVPDGVDGAAPGGEAFAYSAVADEDDAVETVVLGDVRDIAEAGSRRRATLLTGIAVAATAVTAAALALVVTLAINIRTTTIALRPVPGEALIVPTAQAPAPEAPAVSAPAPVQLPAVQPAPAHVVAVPPAAPALPAAPAPAPIPAAPPVVAPVPVAPLPIPVLAPAPAVPRAPQLPVHLPALQPPMQIQTPQPVQSPYPQPVHRPVPPSRVVTPPEQNPWQRSPVRVPGGQQPGSGLTPQQPVHLPAQEPRFDAPEQQPPIRLPQQQPRFNVPAQEPPLRSPEMPRMPEMPAPQAPIFRAPVAPRMPSMPQGPRLNLPRMRF